MSREIYQLLDVVTPDDAVAPTVVSLRSTLRRRKRRRLASAAAVAMVAAAGVLTITQFLGSGDSEPTRIESIVVPDKELSLISMPTDRGELGSVPGSLVSDGQRFYIQGYDGGESSRWENGYVYQNSTWLEVEADDRMWVPDLAGDDGVLYVLHHGTASIPELGTSSDGGATWQWHNLESDFEARREQSLNWAHVASRDGVQLVVFARSAGPDFREARGLIKEAIGVDIDDLGNEASGGWPTLEGVELTRVPASAFEVSACDEALGEAWNQANNAESLGFTAETVGQLFTEAIAADGCRERAECAASEAGRQIRRRALSYELDRIGIPWNAQGPLHGELVESCERELADISGAQYDDSQATIEFISWEEMGVTVPDDWQGEIVGLKIEGSRVTELGSLFPIGESRVIGVSADIDGFRIATEEWIGNGIDAEVVVTMWRAGPDLEEWTASEVTDESEVEWIASEVFHARILGPDYSRYVISYTADDLPAGSAPLDQDPEALVDWLDSSVTKVAPDGSKTNWPLAQMAPDLEGSHLLTEVAAGPLGIAAVAEPIGDVRQTGPVLLVSTDDGNSWLRTDVDAGFVHQVAVASDSVMLQVSDSPDRWDSQLSYVIASLG